MNFKVTKDLDIVKQPNYKGFFKASLILNAGLLVLVMSSFANIFEPSIIYRTKEIIVEKMVPEDIKLTDSAIVKELIKGGCMLPNVALAQAKLETGHYKSQVCKQNKNLFGIKKHKCKYVSGENLNHATFKTYKDNIKCYLHIQEHYLKNITGKYASSPTYTQTLRTIK